MKHEYSIQNFKCIRNSGVIEICPITIFVGMNGSGKTSVIQPLLLLAQTLESGDKDTALMTSGPLVNSGTFNDIIHNHNNKSEFGVSLSKHKVSIEANKNEKLGKLGPKTLSLVFDRGLDGYPRLKKFQVKDSLDRNLLERVRDVDGNYTCDFFEKKIKSDRNFYKHVSKQTPNKFLFRDYDIVRNIASFENAKKIEFETHEAKYLATLSYSESQVKSFLSDIKYIGPLRDYPKRYYEKRGDRIRWVGSRGENTFMSLYSLQKDKKKSDQLNKWLKEFGMANSIKCEPISGKSDLLEIIVESLDGVKSNFADSCFGISQILPILVQSIQSVEDDIIIAEQPEIHLNPNCEVTLADLFVETVNSKKSKYIIETHSDHYLLRLRTHIKTGKIKNSDVAVYIADTKSEQKIRRIEIDDNGMFKLGEWPKGLFDQGITESLKFATAKKK